SILFSSKHVNPVQIADAVQADFVHPCFERFDRPQDFISGEWMQVVRDNELGVVCWHEERPDVIHDLYELGVDGICSDNPELLFAEYQSR
ncbi:MAG: glycerophosphodiester phosphodiesterase, partial [Chloroflexota bacterium]